MRVRGYDEETNQLSDDLVGLSGDVLDLTKTASNPNGISLFTDASQTQYKDLFKYMQEIAGVYNQLDEKSRQNLLEKLFGKNRASVGAAILTNFSAAEKAMDTMSTSAGSAEREMATIEESISYHLNTLKETWVGIAQDVFAQDSLKGFIDGLTSVSNVIGTVVSKFGLLKTVVAGAGIFAFVKNLSRPKGSKSYCI